MALWITSLAEWLQHSGFAGQFLDASLKTLLLVLAALIIYALWRGGSASSKHLVLFVAIAGTLCLPVLSRMLPSWRQPLWTIAAHGESKNLLNITLAIGPGDIRVANLQQKPVEPAIKPAAPIPTSAPVPARTVSTHLTSAGALAVFFVWMAGALFCFAGFVLNRVRLLALRKTTIEPTKALEATFQQECTRLRISRQVELVQSTDRVMPMTWGAFRPVVLLPAEATCWTEQRLRAVILHELAHVRRWDCLTQSITQVACALYWFNPLVWISARQMIVQRERACDDIVLHGGHKASDYAGHLLEIAKAFRPMRYTGAAIAMAHSPLERRISAIVEASRNRSSSFAALVLAVGVTLLCLLATAAAPQKSSDEGSSKERWFDARLRAFFSAKTAQARTLAEGAPVHPDAWRYFEAGSKGDWKTMTNLSEAMSKQLGPYAHGSEEGDLSKVWGPYLDTVLAWETFSGWQEKHVLAFGNDVIRSIPPGSVYFGGTDAGRGVITAMSESHIQAKPFFTITQNALADANYLNYVREMYGQKLEISSEDEARACFQEYITDAQRRLKQNKLKPGEDIRSEEGRTMVSGRVAVMQINALIVKSIFDKNPKREFYVEESFPLDWMYPHLSPHGLIMKVNRNPLTSISDESLRKDRKYWADYLKPLMGDWIAKDISMAELTGFVERVYVKHDLDGFTGSPSFVKDIEARKCYSKLRSSLAGLYAWRLKNTENTDVKKRMAKEADHAFAQAYAICPFNPEAVARYSEFLVSLGRFEEARLMVKTSLKLDPKNTEFQDLEKRLRNKPTQ